ncbi:HAMP domain-containing sensor histidine kinase [Streptomyces jeddahensis]|uniref:histidine kinase n=1 Tax=Streptomyces jeddahensis TaxID=1716141 RepID=A0A177HE24_9ACTN|nr:ATP-binding protein [Streptomyces jeddahensis]OAH09303.1 signal transduction histidine-protein kinase/phosphatase MprB [Streptomyces jeddahensis]
MRRPGVRPPSSLRTTFAVSFAAVAAAVTVLIGFLSYDAAARLVRVDQRAVFDEVVHGLQEEVRQHRALAPDDFTSTDADHDGPRDNLIRSTRTNVQVLGPGGRIVDRGNPPLPVGADDRSTTDARTAGTKAVHDEVEVGEHQYRVATVALGGGRGAVQVAQEFSDTEDLLRELQKRTVALVAAIVVAAGLFGWWLARRITGRLVRLTDVAEGVARTGRLDTQVPVAGRDEVGRLGRAFDRMLGRLAQSVDDQRRLVQDAGHELRTPLTSLRTNISLLRRIDELPPAAREELVADLAEESRELTDLVNELVDLAAGQQDDEPVVEVALGEVAEDVAGAARRRTGRVVTVQVAAGDMAGTVVEGRPAALQRAVSNLVENAAKFDPGGTAPIEIVVTAAADAEGTARVEVRDRGPGIAEEHLPRVFDRFYRAPDARGLPGSGLGLSIVREVAASHGGTPFARRRPGGGAVIGFTVGKRGRRAV